MAGAGLRPQRTRPPQAGPAGALVRTVPQGAALRHVLLAGVLRGRQRDSAASSRTNATRLAISSVVPAAGHPTKLVGTMLQVLAEGLGASAKSTNHVRFPEGAFSAPQSNRQGDI